MNAILPPDWSETTGRDEFIIGYALAFAIAAIDSIVMDGEGKPNAC